MDEKVWHKVGRPCDAQVSADEGVTEIEKNVTCRRCLVMYDEYGSPHDASDCLASCVVHIKMHDVEFYK